MVVSMLYEITCGQRAPHRQQNYSNFISRFDDLGETAPSNFRLLFGCSLLEMCFPCALFIIGMLGLLLILPHTSFCSNAFYGGLLGGGITLIVLETLFVISCLSNKFYNKDFYIDFFNYKKTPPTEPLTFGDI